MEATHDEGRVRVTGDARQQLYDASGYGEPLGGDSVALSPVEAAYLLSEGKVDAVDGDGYADFVARAVDNTAALRAYSDLRDRGYYLDHDSELLLYERGDHPANSSPKTRVEAVDEYADVRVDALPSLLAVADDDGDVTYFSVETVEPAGDFPEPGGVVSAEHRGGGYVARDADGLLGPRYGAETDDGSLALSPVEAAYLHERGVVEAPDGDPDGGRLAVYADLRDRRTCPRTGFKFGSDFRVYETTEDDHASLLVSVVETDATVPVTELSRFVRLAHGVRKRAVYALVGDGVGYVAVERERP